MPETEQSNDNQKKSTHKKKRRSRPWLWFALYGLAVLAGLTIGSAYFDKGADRAKFWVDGLLSAGVLSVVIVQAVIYRKQWQVMERTLIAQNRAYLEIHSIETSEKTSFVTVKVENIGQTPATKINIDWKLFAYKDGQRYKQTSALFGYDRLARGAFKAQFDIALYGRFTAPEVASIVETVNLPIFLEFRISYYDGFQDQVSDSLYGYIGKPKSVWLPLANVKTFTQADDNRRTKQKTNGEE